MTVFHRCDIDIRYMLIVIRNGDSLTVWFWYANLIALAIAQVVDRVALRNTGSNHRERRLF
jgi:hypothetical protein